MCIYSQVLKTGGTACHTKIHERVVRRWKTEGSKFRAEPLLGFPGRKGKQFKIS